MRQCVFARPSLQQRLIDNTMRPNRLKETLASGKPAIIGWTGLGSSFAAEILGVTGVDAVLVDCQHGQVFIEQAVSCLQGISASGVTPLARCTDRIFGEINKLLDSGAMGIVCPMIETADQAADFVSMCTYPPKGRRSFGPTRAVVYYGDDYFSKANDEVLKIVMIETRTGLSNADAIMQTPGVDGVLVGPGDLSLSLTDNPAINFNSGALPDAMKLIVKAAHDAGKQAWAWCNGVDMAAAAIGMGFDAVVPGPDAAVLRMAYADRVKAIRALNHPGLMTRTGDDRSPGFKNQAAY
jgi:4-hydroxy-2-oxoheptanedioate aldolase